MDDLEPASREEIRDVAREGRQLMGECQILQGQQDARITVITGDVLVALEAWSRRDARSTGDHLIVTEAMERIVSLLGELNALLIINLKSILHQSERLTNEAHADASERLLTLRSARDEVVRVLNEGFGQRQSVLEEYEAAARAFERVVAQGVAPVTMTGRLRKYWRT
ncbi:MAG: hypothetical protein ACYC19_01520 [Acidimicrobiales bacterium]